MLTITNVTRASHRVLRHIVLLGMPPGFDKRGPPRERKHRRGWPASRKFLKLQIKLGLTVSPKKFPAMFLRPLRGGQIWLDYFQRPLHLVN